MDFLLAFLLDQMEKNDAVEVVFLSCCTISAGATFELQSAWTLIPRVCRICDVQVLRCFDSLGGLHDPYDL